MGVKDRILVTDPQAPATDEFGSPAPERPEPREPSEPPKPPGLAQRARGLSGLTMLSRVLGVVREQVFARLFGAGMYADALVVAFRVPNLLRDLFAEGAFSATLIPALGRARAEGGDEEAARVARAVLSAILLGVGALTVLGIVFAPTLVDGIAKGFSEGAEGATKREETIRLTRVLFPFLLLISLASVLRGVLNTYGRFSTPALGPPLANALAIAIGGGLLIGGASTASAATGWACALLAGGVGTLLVQVPALRRTGLRILPDLRMRHPELGRILRQMGFAAVGLAAVQVNIFVGTTLASQLAEGSVAALNYGFRLVYLPIGVIGVAIATVSTVDISRGLAGGDRAKASEDLAGGIRLTAFLSLPSAVGLWVLSEPVVRLIYEYAAFTASDTTRAAIALRGYGIGLLFYAITKIQIPACYALGRERLPIWGALLSMAGFTTFALLTYRTLGVLGLAIGTSIAASLNAAVLAIGLRQSLPARGRVLHGIAATLLLAAIMGVAIAQLVPLLEGAWGTESVLARLATVGLAIALGGGIVLGGGRLLRLPEATETLRALRIGRTPSSE